MILGWNLIKSPESILSHLRLILSCQNVIELVVVVRRYVMKLNNYKNYLMVCAIAALSFGFSNDLLAYTESDVDALARQAMTNLYEEVLGREPDEVGLHGKIEEFKRGDSLDVIRDRMAHSDESKINIKRLYQQILCRKPDKPGFEGKLTELSMGSSLEDVRQNMLNGDERRKLDKEDRCPQPDL